MDQRIAFDEPWSHRHEADLHDTLDFLNTLEYEDGFPVDHLTGYDEAIAWFTERGLLHPEVGQKALETGRDKVASSRALRRVRLVRAALREVADAVVEARPPEPEAIENVNRALRAREVTELVQAPDGVTVGHRHVGDPIDDVLARIADPLVTELAGGHPDRFRICANDACRWVFYDESRAGRRRWCDMASCGNRAKAARHRARKKAETAPGAEPN